MKEEDTIKTYYYIYDTFLGRITVVGTKEAITQVRVGEHVITDGIHLETDLIRCVANQLKEYEQGERTRFDVPLAPVGTPFQRKVWEALGKIPFGETRTYKQIAEAIENPKACRAVGMANNRNPILIFIPCHRVIGADGSLVGYGAGIELKEKLLQLEQEK